MNLLGWHWFIKLYRFQVYNSIIYHLYIVLYVHHPEWLLLLLPFIPLYPFLPAPTSFSLVNIILLSVFLFFCFFCLIPSPFLPDLQPPPLCSLYLWAYVYLVCLFLFIDFKCEWNHMVFVFHWLISLIIMFSRSIPYCRKNIRFPFSLAE